MKQLLFGLAAAMMVAYNAPKVAKKTGSEQLAERMQKLQQRGYMMGH